MEEMTCDELQDFKLKCK